MFKTDIELFKDSAKSDLYNFSTLGDASRWKRQFLRMLSRHHDAYFRKTYSSYVNDGVISWDKS